MLWLGFIVCTCVIVYSGAKLARYGDIIAEKTGLGRTWVGVVLLATVTSLPELATGISSVTYAGVPDIAVGDVLGSCVFNMAILAVLDALTPPKPIFTIARQGHVLSAAFGLLLISLVCANIFVGPHLTGVSRIEPSTIATILIYFVAMRMVFSYEKRQIADFIKKEAIKSPHDAVPLRTAVLSFSVNGLFIVSAATFLPKIGEGIARSTGLGQSFVGNILIAISTSLPEIVVSVAAVRSGAVDLAVGNLFGSNIFNIFILALDDIFLFKGPLFSYTNPNHLISGLSAIAMTTLAVIGLTYRAERKRWFVTWNSMAVIVVYLANVCYLYVMR
jgi:cation:H+ antiporter